MEMRTDNSLYYDDKNPKKNKLNFWLEIGLILLIVLSISMITLSAANPKTNPPGRDGGFFLYVGKAIKSGAQLYIDIWDSKGPMIFWINALGVGTDYSRWGVFFIEVCFETIALFIAYWVLKRMYGILPALGTVFIGAGLLKLVIGSGNSTEEYSFLFTWIAIASLVLLMTKNKSTFWSFFLIGASTVINFLLRANNIGTQIIVILAAIFHVYTNERETKLWRAVTYLIIGALTIAIPVSLYFIINGSFKAMIDASIIYNFSYSTATGHPFSNSILPAIGIFRYWLLALLVIWILCIWHMFDIKQKGFTPFLLLTILALPIEIFMSSISGRGYTHYFICWIPACMLLIAFGFSIVQNEAIDMNFRRKCETTHTIIILVLLCLITIGTSFNTVYDTVKFLGASIIRPNINREYREPAAKVVRDLTDDTDKVLVFAGQAGINIMAQRDSIKGALFYPAINNSDIGIEVQNDYFKHLQEEQPLLILDGHTFHPQQIPAIDPSTRKNQRFVVSFSENLEQVLDWINENYERYDEANGYIIYRLRSSSQ